MHVFQPLKRIHIAFGGRGIETAKDQEYLLAEVREVDRVAQRRIARADDRDLFAPEESSVADRAPADASAAQRILTGDTQLLRL